MWARALALWCAVVALSVAAAYTVDCNHEFTDCDTELSKIAMEDDELPTPRKLTTQATTTLPTRSTQKVTTEITTKRATKPHEIDTPQVVETTEAIKPKPRLLNLNVDELQNFANALHNQTFPKNKKVTDLSDVNLDDDDEDPRILTPHTQHKGISDNFYSNLQAPFNHPGPERERSEEVETCKENEVLYKVGEKIDRGCEETCECSHGGLFECSPRCKHPYIRRGRRLNDPLCFESPVDECCSIIACATGNGETKPTKIEVCRYGNDTHPVGENWHIGCEQTCICEPKSVITCKPRCKPLIPSDKCINVQDPNDACCEVQVCDVSQDVHELSDNVTTTTTTTTTTALPISDSNQQTTPAEGIKASSSTTRPLVLAEPIGSVKVLQNNSVQVNLIHPNKSEDPVHLLLSNDGGRTFEDVELKYRNLILNLEGGKDYVLKTKETGTKFNFTITATDGGVNEVVDDHRDETVNDHREEEANEMKDKTGCWEDGEFFNVGEEFHIGCSELCECTGPDTRECVALICPNHVGLELMSKGCVRWAPSPPAQPPNCCPRSARCLSDGTCHYNGVPVPNWSEVPIHLTGCEQRCFCENGELDCQEVCTPLKPVPPQNLRCPPMHRPAPVNISDDDCCKQWGCVPNAGSPNISTFPKHTFKTPTVADRINYVTLPPVFPSEATLVLPTPPLATDSIDFYKKITPTKSFPKVLKTVTKIPHTSEMITSQSEEYTPGDNITVFTLDDIESPFKTIQAGPPLVSARESWNFQQAKSKVPNFSAILPKSHTSVSHTTHTHPDKELSLKASDGKFNVVSRTRVISHASNKDWVPLKPPLKPPPEAIRKVPMSSMDNFNYFLPTHDKRLPTIPYPSHDLTDTIPRITTYSPVSYFAPQFNNRSDHILIRTSPEPTVSYRPHMTKGKLVTVLKSKDLRPNKESNGIWAQYTNTHVLDKQPNPYETVLMNAVPTWNGNSVNSQHKNINTQAKAPSTINLEHLLSQMELESEVNRNLGRSADQRKTDASEGHVQAPDFPHKTQPPSFLPTIPPEIRYPNEDLPDYDQNNIHRPTLEAGLPPGLQVPPSFGDMNKKLTVISIEADSPTSIKMLLGLPPVLVGLRGSVDLRYTDKADEDISHWSSQVFAPADEILTTPRLEFRLTGLKPSTTYKVRGKLYLHNLPVSPESESYSVRTLDLPVVVPQEEKRREIDSRLSVVEVNDTAALLTWRHFTEDELQFIDGIQVRYRPVGTPIYSMTELLHHSRSTAHLVELRPNTRYEAGLVLVPPPRALTELRDRAAVGFTTHTLHDPYNWTVTIEARTIGAEAAEITWQGVPSPPERWVRVYRAAHACGEQPGKEHDEFRLAARDQPPSVTLGGLQADTKCRIWLELFLTNGKVKTSNVIEINTKSLDTDNPIDNEVEASSISGGNARSPRGDYYSALVGVGVVAALGALASLLLLLVVLRRHRPRSVPITPVPSAPRESSLPPYDNPAYKLELQQETMDL